MPSRPACAAILLCWVVAATGLFRRDILPDFWTIPPPDLRSIAVAGEDNSPTRWELMIADDPALQSLRPVGRAVTRTERQPDGGTNLISVVTFHSNSAIRGTPFASLLASDTSEGHLIIENQCAIDPTGNLQKFHVDIHSAVGTTLMTIDARVVGRKIEVVAKVPFASRDWTQSIPYEPRGVIQNGIGPTDRLPGLQVGQRWETKVVSPITGQVEKVLTEVTGKRSIQWNNKVVTTLEVVQKLATISARTWVRRDGLVLRQEVPFPFVRLILERVSKVGDDLPKPEGETS